MSDEKELKGLQTQNLPWLTRVLVNAIFDSLAEEQKSLKEMKAPSLDSFIEWDGMLAYTYARKKVRAIASYLSGNHVDVNGPEYEIAYLRNRVPLRVRVSRLDINDLVVRVRNEDERLEE